MTYGLPLGQLARTDLDTTIEQGRRVEGDLYEENHPGIRTIGELMAERYFIGKVHVLRWEKRNSYAQQDREDKYLRSAGMNPHGPWCPCGDCEAAVKRLLVDCGVLPKGKKGMAWTGF